MITNKSGDQAITLLIILPHKTRKMERASGMNFDSIYQELIDSPKGVTNVNTASELSDKSRANKWD